MGYGYGSPYGASTYGGAYGSSPYGASSYGSPYGFGAPAYGNPYGAASGAYGSNPYAAYSAPPYYAGTNSYYSNYYSSYGYPYSTSAYANPYAYSTAYSYSYSYPYGYAGSNSYTVTATASTTSLVLSWTPISSTHTYRIYQSTASGGGFTMVQTATQGASSATLSGLTPGVTYYFGVAAVDPYGTETPIAGSVNSSSTTSAYTFTVTPTTTSIALTWTPISTAYSYRIYQSLYGASSFSLVQTTGQGTSSVTVGGLTPGYSYTFQVRGVDAYGTETAVYASTTGTTGTVSAPTGLYVTGVTATTASLAWAGVSGATSYRVFVSVGGGSYVAAVLSQTSAISGVVTGLVPSTTYGFQVLAVDAYGNQSSPSTTITITTAS
jgi:fibronectin type 3 domain-containing protein